MFGYGYDVVVPPRRVKADVRVSEVVLFITADWYIELTVESDVKWCSGPFHKKPTKDDVADWLEKLIKDHQETMVEMKLDAAELYTRVTGYRLFL